MIDREKFDEFYRFFDTETMIEVIDIFISEKDQRFHLLNTNLKEKNFTELAKNSHSLKGVIGNFMAPLPSRLVWSLEQFAIAKDEVKVTNTLRSLQQSCDDLADELTQIRLSILLN